MQGKQIFARAVENPKRKLGVTMHFSEIIKGHVNLQKREFFCSHSHKVHIFSRPNLLLFFQSERVFSWKRPLQIRSARHFDYAIFSVMSRVDLCRQEVNILPSRPFVICMCLHKFQQIFIYSLIPMW